ncbi:hypothetical protein GOP47_0012391 [Adiantum capillus-veneris]|uniref:Uncharacterized protein n=1 Tax=Adiantum capillus-veneris TaxID=13818 RepID=A0A9D4UQL0_ADICA|nr:hypothetical protein GOP47_0012391 [Adiantum capillus-veneris]
MAYCKVAMLMCVVMALQSAIPVQGCMLTGWVCLRGANNELIPSPQCQSACLDSWVYISPSCCPDLSCACCTYGTTCS